MTDIDVIVLPPAPETRLPYLLIPLVKQADQGLLPLSEALRAWVTVVAGSADPCFVVDVRGHFVGLSSAAGVLLGRDHFSIIGRRLVDELDLVDFSIAAESLEGHLAQVPPLVALSAGALSRGLVRLRRGDGVIVTLDIVASPLHGTDGSLIGSLCFMSLLTAD